jgi:hypothetical protein
MVMRLENLGADDPTTRAYSTQYILPQLARDRHRDMAGAIQTQTRRATDPGLALVERRRDAGLEVIRALHYCVDPHHHTPVSANFLGVNMLVGRASE